MTWLTRQIKYVLSLRRREALESSTLQVLEFCPSLERRCLERQLLSDILLRVRGLLCPSVSVRGDVAGCGGCGQPVLTGGGYANGKLYHQVTSCPAQLLMVTVICKNVPFKIPLLTREMSGMFQVFWLQHKTRHKVQQRSRKVPLSRLLQGDLVNSNKLWMLLIEIWEILWDVFEEN